MQTETLGCARKGRAELRECEERSNGQNEDACGYALPEEHIYDTSGHKRQRHEPCFMQAVSTGIPSSPDYKPSHMARTMEMAYSLTAVPRVISMFLMTVPKLSLSSVVL